MNQRLPTLTVRKVIRGLERAGFRQSRTSGSHSRLIHASDPARKVTIPIHSGDLKRGTLRGIIAQGAFSGGVFKAAIAGAQPRRQFLRGAADGISHRARAGRADHGEADEKGGGQIDFNATKYDRIRYADQI
jgi:predicted RNA binding protein YcfA (HicA-like mRNA interferase family)